MEEKNIWSNFKFEDAPSKSALDLLNEQKDGLFKSTNGELRMEIEAVDAYEDSANPKLAALYILYVVAPKLGYFRRKILTVIEKSETGRFPVEIVSHLQNNYKYSGVQVSDFINTIETVLSSPTVKNSIENLFSLSKNHSKEVGLDLLIPGHAGVLVLKNGTTMNYGVIRIEENFLVHYTGSGLRELKNLGDEIKDNEELMMTSDYIAKTPLESILKVLA